MKAVSRGGWSRHHQIIVAKYACNATTASTARPAASTTARASAPLRFTASLARELVAPGERPRPRDAEDVRVAPDVVGERRVRAGHLDDLHRGGVEDALARFAVDLDLLDAAVGADENGQDQAAVQLLLACCGRIVR